VLPLESSVVALAHDGGSLRLDRASFAVVAPRAGYRLVPVSAVVQVLTLLPGAEARAAAVREYAPHVDAAELQGFLGATQALPRTRWVDELGHRYLFERYACDKHATAAARFLETEIVKEVYFLCRERLGQRERASGVHQGGATVQAAVAWIEGHLFDPLRVSELASRFHTSESSLLRAFKRELGVSPAEYVRTRRLDEALLLLESGRYSVSEVATRVGYETPAAFSVVFRKRFGHPPSAALGAGDRPPAPPPAPRRERRNRPSR
jgi:AraC-like DNA-binding protein